MPSRPATFPRALLFTALFALAADASAQFKVNGGFRNATEPGWTLTGTDNPSTNNDSAILTGGYGLIADGNNTNDPAGSGWLRLTTDLASQRGNALYTGGSFPSSQGVIVEFDYIAWSGTGADGLSFFLYDAGQDMAGALPGAGLGYCNGAGGYLGIGLDAFGNFSGQAPGVSGGCSEFSASPGGAGQDHVVVRGPLSSNNVFIARAPVPGGVDTLFTAIRPASDRARIVLIPNGTGGYRVTVALGQNGAAPTTVLNELNFPYPAPALLRMGFGGSTGGANNIHEVRGVVTSTPADIRVQKTVSAARVRPGQTLDYTVVVSNEDINLTDPGQQSPPIGPDDAPDIADAFPAALENVAWTCAATPGSTCPAASGIGALAFAGGYRLAPGGALTFTITARVRADATCGSTVTNVASAQFSATDGFSDINPDNNSASAAFTVGCADLSISKTNTPGVNGNADQAGDTVVQGTTTTYTLVVRNAGPEDASGAVVRDVATSGLSCPTATCSSTGGATCPTGTPTALAGALFGTGAVVPQLPAGGEVAIVVVCNVL